MLFAVLCLELIEFEDYYVTRIQGSLCYLAHATKVQLD